MARRPDRRNPFGKTAQERDRIVADTAEVEPLLRSSATVEIDTRRPLAEVVDRLATLVGPPPPDKIHFHGRHPAQASPHPA